MTAPKKSIMIIIYLIKEIIIFYYVFLIMVNPKTKFNLNNFKNRLTCRLKWVYKGKEIQVKMWEQEMVKKGKSLLIIIFFSINPLVAAVVAIANIVKSSLGP